jgi:hypothetical protein
MTVRTFYGVVVQQDMPIDRPEDPDYPFNGPMLMETHLNALSADRTVIEALVEGGRWARYGWMRVATITVDLPDEEISA